MKQSLLILFLVSCSLLSQAQFVPGYYVTATNDTISGYIKNLDWIKSPDSFEFSTTLPSGSTQTISAEQVKGFYLKEENTYYGSYKLHTLDISQDAYQSNPTHYFDGTVFLERVWTAHALVLYYGKVGEDQRVRYFLETPTGLTELINFSFIRNREGSNVRVKVDNYKDQLPVLLQPYASTNNGTTPGGYHAKELIAYLNSVLGVSTALNYYQTKKEKYIYLLGFNAGVEFLKNYTPNTLPYFTYGITGKVLLPRNFNNQFIRFQYYQTANVGGVDYIGRTMKNTAHSIDIQFGTYIGQGVLRPYISAGLWAFFYPYVRNLNASVITGLAYKKRFSLELGHFANPLFWAQNGRSFMVPPRITVQYEIPLN